MAAFNPGKVAESVNTFWQLILPVLYEYIAIPSSSPDFFNEESGPNETARVVELFSGWAKGIAPFAKVQKIHDEGCQTPIIFIEVPSTGPEGTVVLYGHCDKQPPLTDQWRAGLHPYKPVLEGDRLYGRGVADDGYALFASLMAIRVLRDQGVPHKRCVIVIEAGEESGSPDLEYYVTKYANLVGEPELVVCLDSGCSNYDQLWLTTSLRGVISGDLTVKVLTDGIHSGEGSGIVPSSYRIANQLLSRIENGKTGAMLAGGLYCDDIPAERMEQAKATAAALDRSVFEKLPWASGTQPITKDPLEAVLNRTWRPFLEVIGQSGIPDTMAREKPGNVLRAETTLRLSIRIPPYVDPKKALDLVKLKLTEDVPYNAEAKFTPLSDSWGWSAPPLAPWLKASLNQASLDNFGRPFMAMGEGGTIPFMRMLGEKFPKAQFVITGVLGPESNAHGPNEFLHLPTASRLTSMIARVLADNAEQA